MDFFDVDAEAEESLLEEALGEMDQEDEGFIDDSTEWDAHVSAYDIASDRPVPEPAPGTPIAIVDDTDFATTTLEQCKSLRIPILDPYLCGVYWVWERGNERWVCYKI